jgi:hypothetical protein
MDVTLNGNQRQGLDVVTIVINFASLLFFEVVCSSLMYKPINFVSVPPDVATRMMTMSMKFMIMVSRSNLSAVPACCHFINQLPSLGGRDISTRTHGPRVAKGSKRHRTLAPSMTPMHIEATKLLPGRGMAWTAAYMAE